ncbi:MAG: SpoIIE family protein phosphatase [Thermoflexales bacterium]|nr:SpoIIE family protein phosphatase [Thermoflexales bacterium]
MTTTDPAQASGDRLALLYRLSQAFNSSLDLDTVLNRVVDEVIAATHAERGFVVLLEDDGSPVFRVARGMDQGTIDDPYFQVSRSVVDRVTSEGQPILTSDAQMDERFSMRHSVMLLGLRSILCVPLKTREQVTGLIYVDNRFRAGLFTPEDLELLSAIASNAAIAIENARLYQLAVDQGRLERELQMAREVQTSFLPHTTPQIPGWEFAAWWRPAREVAGDYYDFIDEGDGRLGLVIADVTDKGMPAALFMVLTRSIVRASVLQSAPAEGIARANRLICGDAMRNMFVSLFYAQLNPASGELTYVNAGHNPPLLHQAGAKHVTALAPTGMVLGIDPDAAFDQRSVQLEAGDFVVLYTDGVTEAANALGEELGEARLRQLALDQRHAPAAEMVAALEAALGEFTTGQPPFDDVTVLVARRLSSA